VKLVKCCNTVAIRAIVYAKQRIHYRNVDNKKLLKVIEKGRHGEKENKKKNRNK
jgi:hypothetical protein